MRNRRAAEVNADVEARIAQIEQINVGNQHTDLARLLFCFRRLRLPRLLSDDGKALVSVDLAEIRHTPRPPRGRGEQHCLTSGKA